MDENAFSNQQNYASEAQQQKLTDKAKKDIKSQMALLFNQIYDRNDDPTAMELWKKFFADVKTKFHYEIQDRKRMDLITGNFLVTLQDTLGVNIKNLKANLLINSEPLGIQAFDIEMLTKAKRFQLTHKHIKFEVLDGENLIESIKHTRMEIQMSLAQSNRFRLLGLRGRLAEMYLLMGETEKAQTECNRAIQEIADNHID